MRAISTLLAVALLSGPVRAQELLYGARDTLRDDGSSALLTQAGYKPREFDVRVSESRDGEEEAQSPWVVRFASPRPDPTAGAGVNTVVLEWYPAQRKGVSLRKAPAVLVLHTIDPRLFVARGTARALAERGIHGFVMHSPGYGQRRYPGFRSYGDRFFERASQSIADARRARDAIAAIPSVEAGRVSIQGTSLGGFFATAAASLDGAFDCNFIFLAGGDLYGVFTRGMREAAWVRQSLERNGVSDARLRELCDPIDPARTAKRLDPSRTWLYSAKGDQVVPPDNARALAGAIGLAADHHVWLWGDHYAAMLHLPWIAQRIAEVVSSRANH